MTKLDKNVFCPAPWHLTRIRNIGAFGTCCHIKANRDQQYYMQSTTIDQYRNSSEQFELRQSMLNGQQHDRCSYCYKEESDKKISLRQKLNAEYTDWNYDYQADQPLALKEVQIELGNLCNFKCVTCLPELSTQIAAEWKKLNWYDKTVRPNYLITDFDDRESNLHIDFYLDPEYIKSFNDSIKDLDSVRILGGEPFINPGLDCYLDLFSHEHAQNMQLLIATNCSTFKPATLDKIKKFGRVKINFSIDATGDLYEYIRNNGQWQQAKENIHKFLEHYPNFIYTMVITVSTYNLIKLPNIVRDLTAMCSGVKIVLNPVYEPLFLDAGIIPSDLKDIYYDQVKMIEIHPEYQHKTWLRMELTAFARKLKSTKHDAVKWSQFIDYTKNLESVRKNSILDLVPELKQYFNKT